MIRHGSVVLAFLGLWNMDEIREKNRHLEKCKHIPSSEINKNASAK